MKKIPALLVMVSMILACSPRMLYPKLDWLIPWYVDDYISLDRSQSSHVSSQLARQLDWHCRTQLPEYAEFLRSIRRDVDSSNQPLTMKRLEVYNARITRYWYALLKRIGPDIIDILVSASDDQIAELFDNLERKNREMEIELTEQPSQKITRNRQKRMQKRLSFWFSNLTAPQKQAVAEWSVQLNPIASDRIAHRRKVQVAAKRLLEHRNKSVEFEAEFLDLLTNTSKLRTENYQQKIEINTERTLSLLVHVTNTLTPEQKTHFSNRLQSLVADLDQLSCDPALKVDQAGINLDSYTAFQK